VLKDIKSFEPEQIYELRTPFLPVPLIERVMDQGFDCWSLKESEDRFVSYFIFKDRDNQAD
jgi:hypothetical protein